MAYPLIDRLMEMDVKVLITSGYDEAMIPERYRHLPRCEKPVSPIKLRRAAEAMCHAPALIATPRAEMPRE